jgi:hypothetical protein
MTLRTTARRAVKQALVRGHAAGLIPRVETLVEHLAPTLRLALRHCPPTSQVGLVGVYRERNAETLARLIAALPPGSRVALWALDEVAPPLAAMTVGAGAGFRFALLNRCIESLGDEADEWLIVADDDVVFRRGGPAAAVRVARGAGLDLSQPAHTWTSRASWRYNRRRPLVVARRGRFVEIGPLVILSPSGRQIVLPFPETDGMGWGTEAVWASLEPRGLALGVLDAVLIEHLEPMGSSYSATEERRREYALAEAHGFSDLRCLQRDSDRWLAWQPPRRLAGTPHRESLSP